MPFMERLHSALILKTPLYHPNEAHILEQPHRTFLDAIRRGSREEIEGLILGGFDVDYHECAHTPPVIHAILQERLEIVQTLLSHGADVNVKDHHGDAPLHSAVKMRQDETLHLLMRYGARTDETDEAGRTPMRLAREIGYSAGVRILERTPAMPFDDTPLFEAAERGDLLAVARSNRLSDRLFIRDANEQTLLHPAVRSNNIRLVAYLLNKGLDIDAADVRGETPLSLCSTLFEREEMMHYLIRRHATLNHRNERGRSPLMIALERGNADYANLLLDAGAEVLTSDGLHTPLTLCHNAIGNFPEEAAAFRRLESRLLIKGAHVDVATNELGWTPLFQCITRSQDSGVHDILELLFKLGTDVNRRDKNGRSALMIAASTGRFHILQRLMDNYADPDMIDRFGWSALMFAVYYNHTRIVRSLLEYGADVNVTSDKGLSALKIATQYERKSLVDLLLDYGAISEDENRE